MVPVYAEDREKCRVLQPIRHDCIFVRTRCRGPLGASSRRGSQPRLDTQGFNSEPGLTPALEPAVQWMDTLVAVGVQQERHPGARGFSRLGAVEDHLAV